MLGSEDDDQISIGSFGVLGPTFVRFANPEPTDRLTVDGRGGDDIISASIATMELTLAGGSGDNVLLGGPGDDLLIGGNGFDDVRGGKGSRRGLAGRRLRPLQLEPRRRQRRRRRRRQPRLALVPGHERRRGVRAATSGLR